MPAPSLPIPKLYNMFIEDTNQNPRFWPCIEAPPGADTGRMLVSAWFKGDGHAAFNGNYRIRDQVSFDYDGKEITNLHRSISEGERSGTTTLMANAHLIEDADNPERWPPGCEITGKAVPDGGVTVTNVDGILEHRRFVTIQYEASDPLVLGAPDLEHRVDAELNGDGTVDLSYDVSAFPSAGIRVARDGVDILTVITSDNNCFSEEEVNGISGIMIVAVGFFTTISGRIRADPANVRNETLPNPLCNLAGILD